MSMSKNFKIATIAAGALCVAMTGISTASAQSDPTSGRIQQRQAQAQAQYHECASFALRVYNAALSQAGGNSSKVRAARNHYHGNLRRCRQRFL